MLLSVARFEARFLLRNPLLWVTVVFSFAFFFVGASVEGFDLGNEGGLVKNASYAMLRNYVIASVFFMFVTTSFVANAVLRDDETGYGPIIRSTGIRKLDYVLGRFLGAMAVAAACLPILSIAFILGSVMPWTPADQVGPNRLIDHLYAYFIVGLPNLFIHGAIFFALATITRSMMATYLGVVAFISSFIMFQTGNVGSKVIPLIEPFAGRALWDAVRYWTVVERNVNLPELTGILLYNRLIWVGVGIACLALACVTYRFADQGMSRRERKKLKLAQSLPGEIAVPAAATVLPSPAHGHSTLRALLLMRTRFEVKQVVLSPALVVLLALGLFTTYTALTGRDPTGRPSFPLTTTLIPELQEAFAVLVLVIAIYYAGELVWRERDRRVHEIIDATPLPNWAYVVPKTLAMGVVLMAIVLVNVLASIVYQLSTGYTDIELGTYLLWYVLPSTWDILLIAALAMFVQALSRHKTIGWGVMVLFIIWQMSNQAVDHNLLNYGTSPGMPLSEMNGAGTFWRGAWVVRIYWGAFAVLLLLAAHLLWRRGTETRLRPRIAAARRRLTGGAGLVAGGALTVFAAAGAWSYYNINVLNGYRWPLSNLKRQADLEKKYWKYVNLPQPTVSRMVVNIDLYPEELRVVTKGRYVLRNLTPHPINEIHVRLMEDDLELTLAGVSGARLEVDDRELDYQIYRLNSPMPPGDERVLTFETVRWHRGFRNGKPNTRLVQNGTFLGKDELSPVIGMSREGTLEDAQARKHFGLPSRGGRATLEDLSATAEPSDHGGWAWSDITLATSADQTPIAPGRRVMDETRGGRRIARFVSEAPVRDKFSVQSARYAEKHRRHRGVDLSVYHHAPHTWNVDRMLDALAASLDYYQASFGPYQFSHVRILEYPGYANFAQAFAGTIPYSETYGFTADFRDSTIIDHVTATTAHELAHQYWAHQVSPADVEGSLILVETLANYSALMMLRNIGGEAQMRRLLRYTLDRYLGGRAGYGPANEPPLIRAEWQNYLTYHKGALAMYLVQERLGEDAVNRALKSLIQRFGFKGPPYPRSVDLVNALRAEARSTDDQNLITDLFERVVLYDLRVDAPTAVQRADGKWEVSVPVEAKKYSSDERGIESETTLAERIEVGLFTAHPGVQAFKAGNVIVVERRPLRSGAQVLKFVTDVKPTHAGIDPYSYYIDRNSNDNVAAINDQ